MNLLFKNSTTNQISNINQKRAWTAKVVPKKVKIKHHTLVYKNRYSVGKIFILLLKKCKLE